MSTSKPRQKKTAALKRLASEFWKENNHRLPTNAISAIVNAEKFRFIQKRNREENKCPSMKRPIMTHEDFLAATSFEECSFEECFESLGYPTKHEKIIIFLLFCAASQEINSEKGELQEISARAKIPKTAYNQVEFSIEQVGALSTILFGYNSPQSRNALLVLLKNLASVEFRIEIPITATKNLLKQSILFSVSENWVEDKETGEKAFAGVTISLGDLFFYKNCHRYSTYDIEKMLEGLGGEHGEIFGDVVLYFSRYLPAAITQTGKGEEYEAVAAIETVYKHYVGLGKQNRYRAKKNINTVSERASLELQRGKIEVIGEEIKCSWIAQQLKKQDN